MNIVMMNTKKKMNIHEAIKWYDCSELTIFRAFRLSERGSREQIYLIGAGKGYDIDVGKLSSYITDTGYGYGGKGNLQIIDEIVSGKDYCNKIMSTHNILELDEKIKLPIWVMK